MTVFSELRMRPAAAGRWGWDASNTARLAMAGVVIFTLLVGANLATPLYPLLQARLGSPLWTSRWPSPPTSWRWWPPSCWPGTGPTTSAAGRHCCWPCWRGWPAALVFASADSLLELSAGRALQGIAVALATGASSAALRELLPSRPEWASRFTLLASAGGVAAGPAIGGVLSLLPGPTSTPYVIHSLRPGRAAGPAVPAPRPPRHQAGRRPAAAEGPGAAPALRLAARRAAPSGWRPPSGS